MTREESIKRELKSREADQLNLRMQQEELVEHYKKKIPVRMYQQWNRVQTGLVLLRRKVEDPDEHQDEEKMQDEEIDQGQDRCLQRVKNLRKELTGLIEKDEELKRELLAQCSRYNDNADLIRKDLDKIRNELECIASSNGSDPEQKVWRQQRLEWLERRLKQLSQAQRELWDRQKQSSAQLKRQDDLHDAFRKKLDTELAAAMHTSCDKIPQTLADLMEKQLKKEESMLEELTVRLNRQEYFETKLCANVNLDNAMLFKIENLKVRQAFLARYQSDECDYLWKLKEGLVPKKPAWGGAYTPKNYHDFLRMQQQLDQEMKELLPQMGKNGHESGWDLGVSAKCEK